MKCKFCETECKNEWCSTKTINKFSDLKKCRVCNTEMIARKDGKYFCAKCAAKKLKEKFDER